MVAEKKDTGAGRFVFLEGGFGELFQKVRFKILGGQLGWVWSWLEKQAIFLRLQIQL